MKNHITSVLEFQEAGLVLKGPGGHAVRVLGALKVVRPPNLPVTKEELSVLVDRQPFGPYYAEDAPETPEDELFLLGDPEVPALHVTRDGQVVLLGRNLDEIA